MEYHVPVMLQECLDGLAIKRDGIYVDATFGGGGHSKAILEKLGPSGRLIGLDRDADALKNKWNDDRLTVIRTNYRHIRQFLKLEGVLKVDGILADLGISSYQINEPERGFSFRYDEALDMRMDRRQALSAYQVVNEYSAGQLQTVLSKFGEVRNARTLARRIAEARQEGAITSTGQLREVALSVPHGLEHKYLAQVFQAIRIEVNEELEALQEFLRQAMDLLVRGGRLVVLSYHSLEDRLVKNFIRKGVFEGEPEKDLYGRFEHHLKGVNKKPGEPSPEEIKSNPRARSARLRIAEKI